MKAPIRQNENNHSGVGGGVAVAGGMLFYRV
jgi:hypothetical protein